MTDPVGAGLVDSLSHPGGHLTGFMLFEYTSAKRLDLPKEIAPDIKRAAVLRNRANPAASAQFGAIQAVGSSQAVEVNPINVRDAGEIEQVGAYCGHILNGAKPASYPWYRRRRSSSSSTPKPVGR
jgi:putative tryptophan/tyrosine transport system substrate-binding protein